MPKLYQHQLDDTYYTRLYWPGVSAIVTRQIHPDGVVFLKRQGVQLEGEIPLWLIEEMKERNWLATKEEMPYWGIVDWPKWHLIDAPKPKPFPKENPFIGKQREAAKAAAEQAERQERESKREANRERDRRYHARKRAEAEGACRDAGEAERKAEAKRAARRERDRRYRARKKAEAEAAQEAIVTATPSPDSLISAGPLAESPPADLSAVPLRARTPTKHDVPPVAATMAPGSLTQIAPRQPLVQSEPTGWTQTPADGPAERGSPRLLAVMAIIVILLLVVAARLMADGLPL